MGGREEWMYIVLIFTGTFKITIEDDGYEVVNIPVDGSGRVSVLDISNDTESVDSGLLCRYRTRIIGIHIQPRWQLNGVRIPRYFVDDATGYHGWISIMLNRHPNLEIFLRRTGDGPAREGFFSCYYDDNASTSVGIFYPSE